MQKHLLLHLGFECILLYLSLVLRAFIYAARQGCIMPRGGRTKREVFRQLPFFCNFRNDIFRQRCNRLIGGSIVFCNALIIIANTGDGILLKALRLVCVSLMRQQSDRTELHAENGGTALYAAALKVLRALVAFLFYSVQILFLLGDLLLRAFHVRTELLGVKALCAVGCGKNSCARLSGGNGCSRQLRIGARCFFCHACPCGGTDRGSCGDCGGTRIRSRTFRTARDILNACKRGGNTRLGTSVRSSHCILQSARGIAKRSLRLCDAGMLGLIEAKRIGDHIRGHHLRNAKLHDILIHRSCGLCLAHSLRLHLGLCADQIQIDRTLCLRHRPLGHGCLRRNIDLDLFLSRCGIIRACEIFLIM